MLKWLFLPLVVAAWVFWLRSYLFPTVDQWKEGLGYVQEVESIQKRGDKVDLVLKYWFISGQDTVYAAELFEYNMDLAQQEKKTMSYPKGKPLTILINPNQPMESTAFPDLAREGLRSTVWGYVALFATLIWLVWVFKANPTRSPKP